MTLENHIMDVWGVFPHHRICAEEGTVQFVWRAWFCPVANLKYGPYFKTRAEAVTLAEQRTADNEEF